VITPATHTKLAFVDALVRSGPTTI
jgi:hypothetical protein